MAVMFTRPASMHEGGDFETVKEVIDFALNINPGLRLGGDTGGPFEPFLFDIIVNCRKSTINQ